MPFIALEAGLRQDTKAKILYGVQVAMLGEAEGHGVELDSTTLDQIVELGNAKPEGIKVRFGHPSLCTPALGTFLGLRKNFVRDGDFVRADLHMSEAADPAKAEHVLKMAQHHPDQIGNSVVITALEEFREGPDGQRLKDADGNDLLPVLRVTSLKAVDVVDQPASGNGMFAEPIPGVELSAREIIKLQSLLDNPEVVSRALEALQARAGVKVESTPPAPVTDALSERERVSFIMRTAKGKNYLSAATAEHKDGLVQFALETGMTQADFLEASLELAHKAATLRELELCSDDIPVESCDPEAKQAPRGASLAEQYYKRFLNLGYTEQQAQSMAIDAAQKGI
jgi:hypothetical protein